MPFSLLSSRVSVWRRLVRGVAELLYPDQCPWCDALLAPADDRLACPACAPRIERIKPPLCQFCGLPVEAGVAPITYRRCRATPPSFDRLRGVVVYGDLVASAIARFKYKRNLPAGYALANVLAGAGQQGIYWSKYDAILPVPLYPARFRRRWFNQSLFLISEMPNSRNLPIRADWLRRVRNTQPQASLNAQERPDNVKGAFRVAEGAVLRGRTILLVDDVATTGSTLNECARVCKQAGAAVVDAVVVARAKT